MAYDPDYGSELYEPPEPWKKPEVEAVAGPQDGPAGLDREKATLYRSVFNTPGGRAVLEDLLSISQFYGESWSPDPHTASYNAGMRRFVGRILNLTARGKEDAIDEVTAYYKDKEK